MGINRFKYWKHYIPIAWRIFRHAKRNYYNQNLNQNYIANFLRAWYHAQFLSYKIIKQIQLDKLHHHHNVFVLWIYPKHIMVFQHNYTAHFPRFQNTTVTPQISNITNGFNVNFEATFDTRLKHETTSKINVHHYFQASN